MYVCQQSLRCQQNMTDGQPRSLSRRVRQYTHTHTAKTPHTPYMPRTTYRQPMHKAPNIPLFMTHALANRPGIYVVVRAPLKVGEVECWLMVNHAALCLLHLLRHINTPTRLTKQHIRSSNHRLPIFKLIISFRHE